MVLTKAKIIEQKSAKENFLSNYRQKKPSLKALLDYIQVLYDCGGPTEAEYEALNDALNFYRREIPDEEWKKASETVANIFGEDFKNSIAGHAYCKPYGYPGDFEVIDKMYLEVVSDNPQLKKWDLFYHQHAAATAVRNRKTFFKKVLKQKYELAKDGLEILDVASGPCRDLLEFFEETGSKNVHVDCVEADIQAILHATKINHRFLPYLTFHNKNIFRFISDKKYDVIWSAGLFDYFNDRTFTRLLARLFKNVKPSGELIVGNFAVGNPTEGYMELFTGWYLYHRSPEQLIQLAQDAGIEDKSRITIDQEEVGVNLFMRIQF
ncbi:MAG: class I SAM-dependent methyltransferase [Bacteroidota bacterium]